MFQKSITLATSALVAAVLSAGGALAATVTLDYGRLPPGTPNQGISQYISTTVSDSDPLGATFTFSLLPGAGSSQLNEIYFDDAGHFGGISISAFSAGVNYTVGNAAPADLSQGNTATPAFVATAGLNATPVNGAGGANRIDLGESLSLLLTYNVGFDWGSVIAGLTDGSLRVGVRGTDPTSSYVNNALAPVPLPASGLVLAGAVLGLGALRRKRRQG